LVDRHVQKDGFAAMPLAMAAPVRVRVAPAEDSRTASAPGASKAVHPPKRLDSSRSEPTDTMWVDGRDLAANPQQYSALLNAWQQLAMDAAEPNPFAEADFLLASVQHIASDNPVTLLIVRETQAADARLLGVLPLTQNRQYGRLPLTHVTNWQHANAFLGGPLIRAGAEAHFWQAALIAIDSWDQASGLLHLTGLPADGPVHQGLQKAAAALRRPCDIVHNEDRAALIPAAHSPESYWQATVRGKKRKELRRQAARLRELGAVARIHGLPAGQGVGHWIADFIALEQSGWKGAAGSALGGNAGKAAFFAHVVQTYWDMGRADLRSITLDGRPIAMLVHFFAGDMAFSFKTAFDESLARFSPGVLIQQDNLALITRPGLAMIDSCAAPNHPMINSLWMERRRMVRMSIPLGGTANRLRFSLVRILENIWTRLRSVLSQSASPPLPPSDDTA
jgi:CelD/BcsL family acetyltransferase involved in cellulose biosynthesis